MKRSIKRLLTFVCCIIFSVVFCLSSSALSANEYGLGLTVDCQEQDSNTFIDIKLKNSNSFDVDGISLVYGTPDGLQLVSGKTADDIGTLKSGDTYKAALSLKAPAAEQVAAEIPQPGTVPEKEKNNTAFIAAALIAIAAVAAIFIKKNRKAAALMLAAAIMLPFAGMFSVHAVGLDEAKSFTLDATVTVDGKEYPLSVKVNYTASTAKNSYFEFGTASEDSEKDGQTVTALTTGFSGTATANEAVKNVTYEIRSEVDGYEKTVTGEAALDGCDWSVDKLALKPGKNEITFTAELENGETQTQVYELTYNRGELYQYTPEEVREEDGTRYVENVIDIYFESDVTDGRIAEILAEQKLAQIGESNSINLIQVRAAAGNLDELRQKCADIQAYSEVALAQIEELLQIELNSTPNDPWCEPNKFPYTETWSEEIPNGINWHVEAIEAPSAWEYEKYFTEHVNVGMIDSAIDTGHEDFSNLISFATNEHKAANSPITDVHGTHVAGIIGAKRNNGKGISGLLNNVTIYGVNYSASNSDDLYVTIAYIADQFAYLAEVDVKAINLSLGLSKGTNGNPYLNVYSDARLKRTAEPCVLAMSELIKAGKEFVVVQSAGNGTIDTRIGSNSFRSDDAVQNGLFCAVKTGESYGSLTKSEIQQVYERIIVVGAVENYSTENRGARFYMWHRSNGGSRVDVYAPGVNVFSTIPLAGVTEHPITSEPISTTAVKYFRLSGTSQAAPIVTAVAAMCFSINPNLTGKQVRDIIRNSANSTHIAYDYSLIADGTTLDYHPFEGDGHVISMKLCAEAALRTTGKKASYTYLNMIVAAAQSLNPDDYTNYEIVQNVLSSIEYNLYVYEQAKVDAKALELISAMDKLIDKIPADYSKVTEAVNKANALDPKHYVNFSAVTNALNAVVYGKPADEQAAVDKMAQDILDAIAALEPACTVSSTDSEIVPDNAKQIVVISPERIDTMLRCLDAGAYTVSFEANASGTYSTGSRVILSGSPDNADGIVYTVVAVGDINGDGNADGEDAMFVNLCVNGIIEPDEMYLPAYDANCDGQIAEDDIELLEQVGLYNDVIINLYEPEAAE